jgi:hypothetical protein
MCGVPRGRLCARPATITTEAAAAAAAAAAGGATRGLHLDIVVGLLACASDLQYNGHSSPAGASGEGEGGREALPSKMKHTFCLHQLNVPETAPQQTKQSGPRFLLSPFSLESINLKVQGS